jgi:hypothetical protein
VSQRRLRTWSAIPWLLLATTGIRVGPRTAGVVVRRNTFDQIESPLIGDGLKGAWVER